MPNDTHPCPGTPRRAGAGTHPPGRRPGRPSHPIRLRAPRLVPLTDEHERAALAALAALLAPLMAEHGCDHTDDRHSDDTGGDHE